MKKIILPLSFIIVGIIIAVVVGNTNNNNPATQAQTSTQKDTAQADEDDTENRIKLMLDWYINPDHAVIIVAQQQGFFEKNNLEVDILEPADPSMPPKLVASKEVDMAVDYQPQLQMSIAQGLPLNRIATLVKSPLNSVVVLDDGKINELADLKGKKIGYSVSGVETSVLKTMLQKSGVAIDDVEMVNVNWSLSPSLMSKKVDAVVGAYRNFELNQLAIEGVKAKAFFPEDYGVPNYDELVVVTHQDSVSNEKYKRFVQALNQATIYIQENPEKSWESFMSYKPKELDTELNRLAWKDTLPYLSDKPSTLHIEKYTVFEQFLADNKLIEKTSDPKNYTTEFTF